MHETVEPTVKQGHRGEEESHPSWALIGASRVSSSPPGAVLFDSEIRHQHYVIVRLTRASRRRDLNHDWLYGEKEIIEVAMSEAQWASFVSSMNVGSGVACTIQTEGPEIVPGMPYAPRLEQSMGEVRSAGDKALADVRRAFDAYKEKKTVANLRHLESMIANAAPNMQYAAQSLAEHAENTVQKARADIEAFVIHKAEQIGLDPGELGVDRPALSAGDHGTIDADPGEER